MYACARGFFAKGLGEAFPKNSQGAMRTEVEGKVWGSARHVFNSPHAAVSILETKVGGYCSKHFHSQRVNRFIVESGSINVIEYDPGGELEITRIRLNPGDVYDVEAGIVHRFEVLEPGIVVEVYFPAKPGYSVSHDDITRLDLGGCIA